MNDTLKYLIQSRVEAGLDAVVLNYDFSSGDTGVLGSGSDFTGVFKNTSPSFLGNNSGLVLETASSTEAEALEKLTGSFYLNENSGVNCSYSNIQFDDFSGASFLRPDDLDSEITFLFSFEKTNSKNGIIFGNLNSFNYSDSNTSFNYGKGFNIGINDRNQLFFQGIDSEIGEYLLVSSDIELANRNILSVNVSPYFVSFSKYNLLEDSYQSQTLRSDSKIQNNEWGENFFIGSSPTYLRSGNTLSGHLDQFLMISGSIASSDLKSISSGFFATGVETSFSIQNEVVTGSETSLVYPIGVTGFSLVEDGQASVRDASDLIEVTLSSDGTSSKQDGERFITGYALANNSGSYIEGTSFLIPYDANYNDYIPTGSEAHSTLGLTDNSQTVESFSISSVKKTQTVESYPLFSISQLTGFLTEEPTGYSIEYLTETVTSNISETGSLQFIDNSIDLYKHDYLHYLQKRI